MPSVTSSQNDRAMFDQVAALNGGAESGSRNKLAKDMKMFLTLLTTQLKHQDPLNPTDSTQFTNQLVQFAQVEQQIGQNEKLEKLAELNLQSQSATAVQYMGQSVEAEHDQVPLQDGKGRFAYGLKSNAKTVSIMITDASGKVVRAETGKTTAGVHEFKWDGMDKDGNKLPDGTYTVSVTALDKSGESIDTYTTVFGKVTGVTQQDGQTILALGDIGVSLQNILSVSPAGAAAATSPLGLGVQYIGKTVEAKHVKFPLKNSEAKFSATFDEDMKEATVKIVDENGGVVREMTLLGDKLDKGHHEFTWDGKDDSGNQLPDGVYQLQAEAVTKAEGYTRLADTTVFGTVKSVTTDKGYLILDLGGFEAPLDNIVSVSDA